MVPIDGRWVNWLHGDGAIEGARRVAVCRGGRAGTCPDLGLCERQESSKLMFAYRAQSSLKIVSRNGAPVVHYSKPTSTYAKQGQVQLTMQYSDSQLHKSHRLRFTKIAYVERRVQDRVGEELGCFGIVV